LGGLGRRGEQRRDVLVRPQRCGRQVPRAAIRLVVQQVGQPPVYRSSAGKRRAVIDSRPDQRVTEMYPGGVHAH
jgi:hypothetical protein